VKKSTARSRTGDLSHNKLRSCYNKCLKLCFGYKRSDSVTKNLFDLGIPCFSTVMFNSIIVFRRTCIRGLTAPMTLLVILARHYARVTFIVSRGFICY